MRVWGRSLNERSSTDGGIAIPSAVRVVSALGLTQILAWGSSYYLPAVLAKPIADDTGWSFSWVVGGLSLGLLIAGLASPQVGRLIHRHGGRPVLIASAWLLAAGLMGLALAPNLVVFIGAWVLMGLGMSAGLYDAAFSALGRTYGEDARRHITALTLFGGFASTVCWPLSTLLLSALGWRGACAAYAAIHLCVCLGVYVLVLPREEKRAADPPAGARGPHRAPNEQPATLVYYLLSATIALAAMISTIISVHLLTILQARDIALGTAVALGALVGPSQVGARFIEMLAGRHHHPIWTKIASAVLVAIGLGLLWANGAAMQLALVLYGAGIGLESIARATLPLVLFGPGNYAPIMGRLAAPSLIAKAAAPSIGAFLLQVFGAGDALAMIVGFSGVNVALVAALFLLNRKRTARRTPVDSI